MTRSKLILPVLMMTSKGTLARDIVYDGCGHCGLEQSKDVAIGSERLAILAVGLRSTAVECSQVKVLTILRYLASDSETAVVIESAILRANGMIGKIQVVPVKVAPGVYHVRRS